MLIQSGVNPILCITGYNISIHKEGMRFDEIPEHIQ